MDHRISGSPDSADPRGEPRGEIDRLWREIEMWQRNDAPPDIDTDTTAPMPTASGTSTARSPRSPPARLSEPLVCEDGAEPTLAICNDVCTLARSICANAERICRLAGELPGDDWAGEKCDGARHACSEATARCCQCTDHGNSE